MAVTDISELRKKRQAKKTRNTIIRVLIVLLICGAVVVAAMTKDIWYPGLRGILTAVPEQVTSGNVEPAEGRFPIEAEGGTGYQLKSMDNALAFLDDSRFRVYSTDGKAIYEKQHTFANPILCASAGKALIYDEGGRDFSLESKYKTVYSKTADDIIYLAEISKSDYAAVVTKSDKFLAMLRIYDNNGNVVFTYYSYDSRIIDVTFNDNSTGCIVTVLTAQGGQLMSGMIRFDFTDTEPKWLSRSVPTLALDVRFTSDGDIIMIGDTMAAGFSSDGTLISQYVYDDKICDYDISGDIAVVLTENKDVRENKLITIKGADCNAALIKDIKYGAEHVFISSAQAYIISGNTIEVYSPDGNLTGSASLEDDYVNFCICGRYIFLMGYDSINRIEF